MTVRSGQFTSTPARASLLITGAALVLFLLAGVIAWNTHVPDLLARQERGSAFAGDLSRFRSLGQSFIATENGLNAFQVTVRLNPGMNDPAARLTLHLTRTPQDATILASASIPLHRIGTNPEVRFSFAPQMDSAGQAYYALVETNVLTGWVTLLSSEQDAYFDGVLLANGQPAAGDLAFRTFRMPLVGEAAHLLNRVLPRLAWALWLTLLFAAIGWSLLVLLNFRPGPHGFGWIWALGLGVCQPPLWFVLGGILGVPLTASFLRWITAGLVGAALIKGMAASTRRGGWHVNLITGLRQPAGWFASRETLGLGGLFMLALGMRLLSVAALDVPPWVDGLSHVETIGAFVQHSGVPPGTLYHIGFHANSAFLSALTTLAIPEMVLVYGQWLIAFGGLTLFVLARQLWGNAPGAKMAALSSTAALWFFANLPGYLVNWGRYPFLQGIALLPLAIVAGMLAVRQRQRNPVILLILLVGGLTVSHYGTLSFCLTFWLAALLLQANRQTLGEIGPFLQSAQRKWGWRFGAAVAVGVLGGVALTIVLFRVIGSPAIQQIIAQSRQTADEFNYLDLLLLNGYAGGLWLWAAGLLGWVVGLSQRHKLLWLLNGWVLCQALLITLQAPWLGEAIASYTNGLLILSLPISLFVGFLSLAWTNHFHPLRWLLIALAGLGAWSQLAALNPTTTLLTPADQSALHWILTNTETSARFWINSNYWGHLRVVPCDGGAWIPSLTGRPVEWLPEEMAAADVRAWLDENRLEYVYQGYFPGFMERAWPDIASETEYEVVYQAAGVRIWQRR
jgi:hypothetical protein